MSGALGEVGLMWTRKVVKPLPASGWHLWQVGRMFASERADFGLATGQDAVRSVAVDAGGGRAAAQGDRLAVIACRGRCDSRPPWHLPQMSWISWR